MNFLRLFLSPRSRFDAWINATFGGDSFANSCTRIRREKWRGKKYRSRRTTSPIGIFVSIWLFQAEDVLRYIYTRQRVIKRSYVIDCANKHLSDWELQLVSERDEITNAGYRDSNFSKMHRQKKFYVNIYIYRTYLFILKKNRTIFTDFRIKNKSSILNDSMRNEYRYRSSLPECYFEGVKGP